MSARICESRSACPRPVAEAEIVWTPHPDFSAVRIGQFDGALPGDGARFALVEMTSASVVDAHVHAEEDDVLYILRGHGLMWTETGGDIELVAGSFLRVPKGVRHRPHDFSDDLRIFNTWVKSRDPCQPKGSCNA